jgi:hypothetical protein
LGGGGVEEKENKSLYDWKMGGGGNFCQKTWVWENKETSKEKKDIRGQAKKEKDRVSAGCRNHTAIETWTYPFKQFF